MQKFCCILALGLFCAVDVRAAAQLEEALRVSCVPEMKVFRAEILPYWVDRLSENPTLLKDNGLYYWERLGLEPRAFETPLNYEVSCEIDGVVGTDTIRTINKIIKNGKANAFKKILSRNRVVFEDTLKDSEKYPGRKKRFERLGQ